MPTQFRQEHITIPISIHKFLSQTRAALMKMGKVLDPDHHLVRTPMDTLVVSMGPPVSSLRLPFRKDTFHDFLVPPNIVIAKFLFDEDGTIRCIPTTNCGYDFSSGVSRNLPVDEACHIDFYGLGLHTDIPWVCVRANPLKAEIYDIWENVEEVNGP